MLTATLTLCGALFMLTACTDAIGTEDNPVKPEHPSAAEELAKETFNNEAWMDRTVKPGDSFWQFALGSWLEKHGQDGDLAEGIMKAIDRDIDAGLDSYHSPVAGKMIKLLTQSAPTKAEEMKVIEDFLSTLKRDGDISKADLIRNFGKMADIGCPALVMQLLLPVDGNYKCTFFPGLTLVDVYSIGIEMLDAEEEEENPADYLFEIIVGDLMGLDLDSPDVKAKVNAVKEIQAKLGALGISQEGTDSQTGMLAVSELVSALQQSPSAGTRSGGDDDLKAVFNEAFHVGEGMFVHASVEEAIQLLDSYDTATWIFYQEYYVYGRFLLVMQSMNDKLTDFFGENSALTSLNCIHKSILLDYQKAMLLPRCDVEGCKEMLEQMRRRMCERIDALQWMSSATKQKAKEKMQAMVFSIGAPERLFNADFQLTGSTVLEAAMQYMRQLAEYQRSCEGKPTYGNGWDLILANTAANKGLTEINAFYSAENNELIIVPAYLLPEAFPADKDNAQRYAVAHIFGHELTHGFDAKGAQYDAAGRKTNWWTDEDLARFNELQQVMIARFNELDQAPGVKANGEKTLNENIADWGGVALAYDLWCERLLARGLSGEALRHQQRQFFLSHADIKRMYKTDETLAAIVDSDVHSVNHNRVNGIVRLLDDWYDLFGVKPGDKLYLAPADRVKIW